MSGEEVETGKSLLRCGALVKRASSSVVQALHDPVDENLELVQGAGGMAEGVPEALRDATLPKFRPGGILLVHAGGGAGLFSMIVAGWANGATGSIPVTRVVQA